PNNSSPAYDVSVTSLNSSGRSPLTRARKSVLLRLTSGGLSSGVRRLGWRLLLTATEGLFLFHLAPVVQGECHIRANFWLLTSNLTRLSVGSPLPSPYPARTRASHCRSPSCPSAIGSPSQSGGVSQTKARIAITHRS